ncbi:MAG: hypothetical protein R2815_14380 [Flavobacteriales bacterium]
MRNISTLSILHYVYGGLICLGGVIAGVMMYAMGGVMNSDLVQRGTQPPPEVVGEVVQGFGLGVGLVVILLGVLVMLSGRWIRRHVNRTGSLILAGVCCLSFPFGTALGIFTFVTLTKEEVRQAYLAR